MTTKLINTQQLKNTITKMEGYPLNRVLISVNWGIWNTASSIACIYNLLHYKTAIISALVGGSIIHTIIHLYSKKKKGYIQLKDTVYTLSWFLIFFAILQLTIIYNEINRFYPEKYIMVFVVLLVGIGLSITGWLFKLRSTIAAGMIWIAMTNVMVYKVEYAFHIHAILSFAILVVFALVRYFLFLKNTKEQMPVK